MTSSEVRFYRQAVREQKIMLSLLTEIMPFIWRP